MEEAARARVIPRSALAPGADVTAGSLPCWGGTPIGSCHDFGTPTRGCPTSDYVVQRAGMVVLNSQLLFAGKSTPTAMAPGVDFAEKARRISPSTQRCSDRQR